MRASLQPPRGNECLAKPVDDLRRSGETVTTAHSIRPWRQNLQPLREETKIGSSTGALPVDQGIADPGEVLFFPESEADHQSFLISQIRLNDELSENVKIDSDASECAPEMSKEERASIICIRQNCFLTCFERRVRLAMLGSVCSVERGTVDLGKVRLPEVKRIEGVARMRRAIGFDEARGDKLAMPTARLVGKLECESVLR